MMDIKISVCKLVHPVLTVRRCGGLELIPNLVPLIAAGLALHSWLSLCWNGDRDATQTAADVCVVMRVASEHQPGVCVCVCVCVSLWSEVTTQITAGLTLRWLPHMHLNWMGAQLLEDSKDSFCAMEVM